MSPQVIAGLIDKTKNHNAMNTLTPVQVEFLGTEAIITTLDEPIAKLFKHPDAPIRASEIVRAINYHDRLVEMLDRLSKAYEVAVHRIDFIKNSGNHEVAAENARNDNMVVAVKQLLTELEKSNP